MTILSWYVLLLVICIGAIMSTTEGMMVEISTHHPMNKEVGLLKKKFHEYPVLIILSDKIKVNQDFSKLKNNYIILKSHDDTTMNSILSHISNERITDNTLILVANKKYKRYMSAKNMYILDEDVAMKTNALIQKK